MTSTIAAPDDAPLDDETRRVLALVMRHGRNTTSFQILGEGYRYAFHGDDACVAFVDTGSAWVAAGAPIAPDERLAEVAEAFVRDAGASGRRASFFATEARFVQRGLHGARMRSLLIGEQPVWDPREWPATFARVRSLREQVRRSGAKGVVAERLPTEALESGAPARAAIEALVSRWLGTRAMAPMGFLVRVDPFAVAEERRLYAAWHRGRLVGVLILVPVPARAGWFFEHLLRDPSAPNGTGELLFDAAMRDLGAEGVTFATFGLAPLAGDVGGWLRLARTWGRPLYDFTGLRAFKEKLRPTRWDPVYLTHPRGVPSTLAIYDTLRAFAQRHLVTFGVATLLRGPDVVVRVLAALLVPWTLALACVDGARWFPSAHVQRGWVVFDVGLAVALFTLTPRWRPALATWLSVLITADAVLTTIEALAWNASRIRGPRDALVIALAIAAPSLAAVVMWNARGRRASIARSPATLGGSRVG